MALTLATTGLTLGAASPASAHCGGHDRQPDRYYEGGIRFGFGASIRTGPHLGCAPRGLGYPRHRIDVHCHVHTGAAWYFVRNLSTGVNGWVRQDALRFGGNSGYVPLCGLRAPDTR